MKLDKIKFARLVTHIQYWISRGTILSYADIDNIDFMVEIDVAPEPLPSPIISDVDNLMALMVEGTRKIEAIKAYRNLTSVGLKDAKDAVERYWVNR